LEGPFVEPVTHLLSDGLRVGQRLTVHGMRGGEHCLLGLAAILAIGMVVYLASVAGFELSDVLCWLELVCTH
jgi:hypothetical protein